MPLHGDVLMPVRYRNENMERKCNKCGEFKPFKEFFRRGAGNKGKRTARSARLPRSYCKLCEKGSGPKSYVPIGKIRPAIQECVERIGLCETARRTGLWKSNVRRHYGGDSQFVYQQTAVLYLDLLVKLRKSDERLTAAQKHRNEPLRRENKRQKENGNTE